METCIACGALTDASELLPTYDDDAIGIPVTLRNGVVRHRCESCGFAGVEIIDRDGLSAAVAVARILSPVSLTGKDVRFLRKACKMTGKQFAIETGYDNSVLSRWENGVAGFGEVTERAIRDAVWGLLYKRVPAVSVEPGHFRRMEIYSLPEGIVMPRMVLERVRLKDAIRHTKSDQWDIYDQAA